VVSARRLPVKELPSSPISLADLPNSWRARADELEPFAPPAAAAFRRAAAEMEEAQRAVEDEVLSLAQAASESGYSVDRLRHMIADGQLPNVGRKGAPRIRRRDMPKKARSSRRIPQVGGEEITALSSRRISYDVERDAREVVARRAR
jgi:hypothetical protein